MLQDVDGRLGALVVLHGGHDLRFPPCPYLVLGGHGALATRRAARAARSAPRGSRRRRFVKPLLCVFPTRAESPWESEIARNKVDNPYQGL